MFTFSVLSLVNNWVKRNIFEKVSVVNQWPLSSMIHFGCICAKKSSLFKIVWKMSVVLRCIRADESAFSSTKCSVVSNIHALIFGSNGGSPIIWELSYSFPFASVNENKNSSINKTLKGLLYILKNDVKGWIKFYIIDFQSETLHFSIFSFVHYSWPAKARWRGKLLLIAEGAERSQTTFLLKWNRMMFTCYFDSFLFQWGCDFPSSLMYELLSWAFIALSRSNECLSFLPYFSQVKHLG